MKRGDGLWHRRPPAAYAGLLRKALADVDMFDLWRAVECPLLIYNCTRPSPTFVPSGDEMMAAYRRGLDRAVHELARERPNITLRTVDATHALVAEIPQQLAAELLVLGTS